MYSKFYILLSLFTAYVLMVVGAGLLVASFVFLKKLRARNIIDANLDTYLLSIEIPSETRREGEEPKGMKQILASAEQLFAGLSSVAAMKKTFTEPAGHITLEIACHHGEAHFYISTPRKIHQMIEKQIYSIYPHAIIKKSGDYTIFDKDSVAEVASLEMDRDAVLPIKTYSGMETDPLNIMATSLSKMGVGEGAAVQIVIRPSKSDIRKRGMKLAAVMQTEGLDVKGALKKIASEKGSKSVSGKIFGSLGSATDSVLRDFNSGENGGKSDFSDHKDVGRLNPAQEEITRNISSKASKVVFDTRIRIVTSAKTSEMAKAHLGSIFSAFTQFLNPDLNEFKMKKRISEKKVLDDFIFRNFGEGAVDIILSTEELVSLWHPPVSTLEAPGVKRAYAKKMPPPANLPKEGLALGSAIYRDETMRVRMEAGDRMRHVYVIGTTGSGKTNILKNMTRQDIEEGKGVCVIDPNGDYIEDIISIVPPERSEDVIIFDPSDTERPMGLNMLEYKGEDQKDMVVNEMIAIFQKLFPPEMIGPMFEHNMRNVMLTLMADPNDMGTIAEIPRMFTDEQYQKTKIAKVTDTVVREFWEKEMAKTSDFHKSEMLGYLVSKVGQFVENTMMRNIIGQKKSAFNFREVMDKGKILLVNLSKGKLGDVNSSLLGLIIVAKLQIAAFARAGQAEEERRDFFLYIDEFQNVVTDTIATILSEARKYRLSLNVAHQFIAQLSDKNEKVRDAVFGNVGTMVVYRVGAADAEFLEKEFAPNLVAEDLINVEKYHANIKLMIDGTVSKPFTLLPDKFSRGEDKERTRLIKELSRTKYGRARAEVEAEIANRAKMF